MTQDSVLQFSDVNALSDVLFKLMDMETEEERFEYMRELVPGFVSLKEKYIRALEEVDSLVNTEEDLELFKQRHPEFYYVNEGEDIGFYLPMEEQEYAYFTSSSGKLIVANQQLDKIKEPSYERLKEEGLTYSKYDKTIKYRDFNTRSDFPSVIDEPYGTFNFPNSRIKEVPKGTMFTSNWILNEDENRKFKVEARRDIQKVTWPGGAFYGKAVFT